MQEREIGDSHRGHGKADVGVDVVVNARWDRAQGASSPLSE